MNYFPLTTVQHAWQERTAELSAREIGPCAAEYDRKAEFPHASLHALRNDPYRQTWEKRLARYLSYQWRCKAHEGRYWQPFRVATLLAAVGAEVDQRKPSRTRERLEKALETLLQDVLITAWQYERWNEAWTMHRGWAQHWLQATILVEPPEVIRATYHRLERHESSAPKVPTRLAAAALGERVKQRRLALGWSQIQAAEHFKVHQATWSRLEHGQVGLSCPKCFLPPRYLLFCNTSHEMTTLCTRSACQRVGRSLLSSSLGLHLTCCRRCYPYPHTNPSTDSR